MLPTTGPAKTTLKPIASPQPCTMRHMSRDPAVVLPFEVTRMITREEMSELPVQRYDGPVHLLTAPSEFEHALRDLRHESVIGFDTETRPAFRRGESYLPSLVQFATAEAVYLVQVQRGDYSDSMREVFSSKNPIKAGVSVKDDLRNLKNLFEFEEEAVVDLGKLARRCGLKQTGVRNLAGIFLGVRIPKGATTTNWAARRLTPQQITYAATDAWVCRELYLRFRRLNLV